MICKRSRQQTVFIDTKLLRMELFAVNAGAAAVCEGLTEEQLAWRPHPRKWSIAENLIHLGATTEVCLPAIDRAIMEYRRRELLDSGPFRLGWYGRLLVWYVEPPPAIRLSAPKALRPQLSGSPERALVHFLNLQGAMMRRMEASSGLKLISLRFPDPLASWVRMNLLEFFSVFNAHSRRHLWQANNVRLHLDTLESAAT